MEKTKPSGYQIAVRIKERNGNYSGSMMEFMRAIDTRRPLILALTKPIKGDYDDNCHLFYAAPRQEDAETFGRKAMDTGLAEKFEVQAY